ncbi:MAG: WecB/TagA/CpsF family glycosyltransferase [candidate division WWE3 bacterium]|nr:WecB/TagA/CpsF family glycosyltransferase [candidate division WWE3 bacterium]
MTTNILGVHVENILFKDALSRISGFVTEPRFHLVTTVNADFLLNASADPVFKVILNSADLSLPDGFGVVLCQRLFNPSHATEKIAGADLVPRLCQTASLQGWSLGLLGGESYQDTDVCQLVKSKLLDTYPGLNVIYCSRESSPEVFTEQIDLLFVAFGSPKQEKWLYANRHLLSNVRVGIGVGGTFDFIVGKRRRASGPLEALWRIFLEPKRLGRVLRAYVLFPIKILLSFRPLSRNPVNDY